MSSDADPNQTAARSSVWQIEFLADGNAIVRRADDSEEFMPADYVPEFLLREGRMAREDRYEREWRAPND